MGKLIVSMAIFQSYFDITKGYMLGFPMISHNFPYGIPTIQLFTAINVPWSGVCAPSWNMTPSQARRWKWDGLGS